MSTEAKRKEVQLGQIIDATAERDAIHVAVAPMVAAERLSPGQHVGIVNGEASGKAAQLLGIVDPFLPGPAFKGERFWMFLYPNTITSLRHDWTHPAFSASPSEPSLSVRYLQGVARQCDMDYENFMSMVNGYVNHNGGLYSNTSSGVDADEDFWEHYEAVTGQKVDKRLKGEVYFSCSC